MIEYSELLDPRVPTADHRIAYGPEALQFGELRLPSGGSAGPLIVYIHGGCWLAEYDITHSRIAAHALANAGFAVWSPEYRRVGDAGGGWTGTFDDIRSAINHVPRLAADLDRIDVTRVILMGHSAGGHLALWAATEVDAPVAGVVSLAGITDLASYAAVEGSCSASVPRLLDGTHQEQPARYAQASPMQRTPLPVPVRIVHGECDAIVPLAQSRDFLERHQAAGGRGEIDVVSGAGHFDVVAPHSNAWASVIRAARSLTMA